MFAFIDLHAWSSPSMLFLSTQQNILPKEVFVHSLVFTCSNNFLTLLAKTKKGI